MTCPKCGMEFEGNFCSNCGFRRNGAFQPTNARPAQTELQRKAQKVCIAIAVICLIAIIPLMIIVLRDSRSSPSANNPDTTLPHSTPTSSPEAEIISISPSQLVQSYQDNEINANEMYLDKVLEISGTIDSIGVDILNQNYLTIGNGNGSFLDTVHCNLLDEQPIPAAALRKGDIITIRGTYVKNVVGVMLDKCTITATY